MSSADSDATEVIVKMNGRNHPFVKANFSPNSRKAATGIQANGFFI